MYRHNSADSLRKNKAFRLNLYDGFMGYVDITDGCWLWNGCMDKVGYGIIHTKGKSRYAHRLSYELFIGELDDGLVLDHLCENKSCVNPFHLEQVTVGENTRRGLINKYNSQINCPHGHLWSENIRYYLYKGKPHRKCARCNVENVSKYRDKSRMIYLSK